MKATKYFRTKSAMTEFAKDFRKLHPLNWYIKTTLECDHVIIQRRKALVLISDETVTQRVILCSICNEHGNSVELKSNTQTS